MILRCDGRDVSGGIPEQEFEGGDGCGGDGKGLAR
jgi:hypothetical protein